MSRMRTVLAKPVPLPNCRKCGGCNRARRLAQAGAPLADGRYFISRPRQHAAYDVASSKSGLSPTSTRASPRSSGNLAKRALKLYRCRAEPDLQRIRADASCGLARVGAQGKVHGRCSNANGTSPEYVARK